MHEVVIMLEKEFEHSVAYAYTEDGIPIPGGSEFGVSSPMVYTLPMKGCSQALVRCQHVTRRFGVVRY